MDIGDFHFITNAIISYITKFKNQTFSKKDLNEDLLCMLISFYMNNNFEFKNDIYLPMKSISFSFELNINKSKKRNKRKKKRNLPDFGKIDEIYPHEGCSISNTFNFYEPPFRFQLKYDNVTLFPKIDDIFIDKDFNLKKNQINYNNNNLSEINISSKDNLMKFSFCSSGGFFSTDNSNSSMDMQKQLSLSTKTNISYIKKEKYLNNLNQTYLNLMLDKFTSFLEQNEIIDAYIGEKLKLVIIKQFIFRCGISNELVAREIIRSVVYKLNNLTFEYFLSSFDSLLNIGKCEDEVLKFKFLLRLTKQKDEDEFYSKEEIEDFFTLIFCNQIYHKGLCEKIYTNLFRRFERVYGREEKENIINEKYNSMKMEIIIESFFYFSQE